MRITSRRKAIAFFITLGACMVALAVALNVGWIVLNWRKFVPLILGVVFFCVIIAGLILNTIFLVREIRRNERHDSFINAVTHELKTPIASIRLYLETLARHDIDPARRQEFYRIMLDDTERLLSTVEQVLKAGEAGQRPTLARAEVDLVTLVAECAVLVRNRYHLPEEAVAVTSTGGPYIVRGDAEELRTALVNVLDNAVKYSGDSVHVTACIEATSASRVEVRVRDRGLGIPRAHLKRIFHRFYRVPSRRALKVKGTGLGLFIVRSIVRRHGGDVRAESPGEGQGATIILELSRARASATPPARTVTA